ncbi:MAG: hypothetical protein N3B21_16030 [Clostridia bacterium]|nr:hypothetical protein [Clostridia bacterium]
MGPHKAWEYICNWISKHIGKIINNKISRIDLCCHTDELEIVPDDIENFKGQFYTDHI